MYGSLNENVPMLDLLYLNVPVWIEDIDGNIRYAENVSADEDVIRDDDEAYETVPGLTVWVAGKPRGMVLEDTLKRVFVDYKDPDNPPPKEVLAGV